MNVRALLSLPGYESLYPAKARNLWQYLLIFYNAQIIFLWQEQMNVFSFERTIGFSNRVIKLAIQLGWCSAWLVRSHNFVNSFCVGGRWGRLGAISMIKDRLKPSWIIVRKHTGYFIKFKCSRCNWNSNVIFDFYNKYPFLLIYL